MYKTQPIKYEQQWTHQLNHIDFNKIIYNIAKQCLVYICQQFKVLQF